MFHSFTRRLLILIFTAGLNPAEAAIIYVDKDNSCPGAGTSASPFCSLQKAFDTARAGDVVRIRESATPYNERAIAKRSGTSTAAIVVEPDTGHAPKLRLAKPGTQEAVIEIRDADYWHIRGLTFDGSGTQTSRYAVLIYAATRDVTGHKIEHNTFRSWGGTGENTKGVAVIMLQPSYSNTYRVKNSFIADNAFTNNAREAIHLTRTTNITIQRNLIMNMLCGRELDGRAGATGIKDSQESFGNAIRANVIRDHQRSADCTLPNQGHATYSGIYCDTGARNGEVSGNTVSNIDRDQPNNTNYRAIGVSSVGIFIESRCNDWRVHGNLVYNIGAFGLRNGSTGTSDPNRTEWTSNTVYGVKRNALWIARGNDLIVKNNILTHNQGNAAIEITNTAVSQGPHSINYNLYWDMKDGTKVGRWGDYATRSLSSWRQACRCDWNSLSSNPSFVNLHLGSEDFRVTSGSPAIGSGENGADLGAKHSGVTPTPSNIPAAPTWISIQ